MCIEKRKMKKRTIVEIERGWGNSKKIAMVGNGGEIKTLKINRKREGLKNSR